MSEFSMQLRGGKTNALGLAAAYATIYSMLIPIAREHGYCLTIHGSLARDLDLVAIPWTEEAVDALSLIKAFKIATNTVTTGKEWDDLMPDCNPKNKPHGRTAYSLHFTEIGSQGAYIDISVMPRIEKK